MNYDCANSVVDLSNHPISKTGRIILPVISTFSVTIVNGKPHGLYLDDAG
jgi:hypothetical protein